MTTIIASSGIEGDLSEFPFPRALQFLCERKVTGRLLLRRGELTKVVYLVEGKPVNVDSTLRDETLGRYLIRKGKISEEDYEKSIKLMIEQNLQQGAALVKLQCLSPRELYHEVKAQNQAKLLSCFAWTVGSFGFYPEVEFVEDMYRFEISQPRLMHEGIVSFFPPGAVELQLARISPGPILPAADFLDRIPEYGLDELESEYALLVNGENDILTLKQQAESYPFKTKILYLLLVTGLVGPHGRPDDKVRSLGYLELNLPPLEEFVMSARETAPEVVEAVELEPETGEETPTAEPSEPGWEGKRELELEEEELDQEGFEAETEEAAVGPGEPAEEGPEIDFGWKQSAPEAAAELPDEEDQRDESEILEYYMGIKSADFFDLLGLPRDANNARVEKAYRSLRAEYDKSRFGPLGTEGLAKLEEINARIIRAYETLRTAKDRKRYLAELEKTQPAGRPALKAEQYLQKGLECVRKRDWPNAQKMFEEAVQSRPEEPEYLSYLGWTIYSNPDLEIEARRKRAKQLLTDAIGRNPNLDSAHVFLGKIFKEEGGVEDAVEKFRTALRCNPRCREAERELKLHDQGEW